MRKRFVLFTSRLLVSLYLIPDEIAELAVTVLNSLLKYANS